MIDRFLKNLYMRIDADCIPARDIDFLIKEDDFDKDLNVIPVKWLETYIDLIQEEMKREQIAQEEKEKWHKPYKKFMYVEDGSVDIDELIAEMDEKNPEIKVIAYRQGSQPPMLIDALSNDN